MWHSSLLLLAFLGFGSAQYLGIDGGDQFLNTTSDSNPQNSVGYNYGAYVERVSLANCPRMSTYTPVFYQGFVANTRGRRETSWTVNRLGIFVSTKSDGSLSSTAGPLIETRNQMYHTWEMLHMFPTDTDIRTKEPAKLRLHLGDGMPQIYIPLYMANAATGDAYMLHLYPERSFLGDPSAYSFTDGVLSARNGRHGLYSVELDVAGLIRDLDNFEAPNYKKFVKDHGRMVIDNHGLYDPWGFTYNRQLSLKFTSKGGANEFICHTTPGQSAYTWTQFRQILNTQFKWL